MTVTCGKHFHQRKIIDFVAAITPTPHSVARRCLIASLFVAFFFLYTFPASFFSRAAEKANGECFRFVGDEEKLADLASLVVVWWWRVIHDWETTQAAW